jgi:hypothetical protein
MTAIHIVQLLARAADLFAGNDGHAPFATCLSRRSLILSIFSALAGLAKTQQALTETVQQDHFKINAEIV